MSGMVAESVRRSANRLIDTDVGTYSKSQAAAYSAERAITAIQC